ncbi:MAG: 5'/3'-nucleotidase SurE [Clostridiales bacterium]|nr:5'/3'-nucleotidase SurE [Clostridiales bacterium]
MHILLVNDDGINARGIRVLCEACVKRGHEVTVCAPHTERSASSHRITLADPIYIKEVDFELPNVRAWSVSGTPADCVRLGLYELVDSPVDAVISGINNGHNAGMAVHYSGTIAAAREGALNHLPSIASSMAFNGPETMLKHLAQLTVTAAENFTDSDVPPHTVLSINAPAVDPADALPAVAAPLSTAGYRDRYVRRESPRSGTYFWLASGAEVEPSADDTDVGLLQAGHITYTFVGNPCGEIGAELVARLSQTKPDA